MKAQEFNKLINDPTELKGASKDDLKRALLQYPYCQSLHLLHLKKLQYDSHPDFNNLLTKTAAFANDRKALYRLIYEPHKFRKDYILHKAEVDIPETLANAEPMLESESIVAAEYIPREAMEEQSMNEQVNFEKHPEADSLVEMESEEKEEENFELQEEFLLMTEAAGGGSEISTDFNDLAEENEEELVDEHEDVEMNSIKTLEAEIEEHIHAGEEEIKQAVVAETGMGEERSFLDWIKSLQGQTSKVKKVQPVTEPAKAPALSATKPAIADKVNDELDSMYLNEIQSKNYSFEKLPDEIVEEIKSIDEFVSESHKIKARPKEYIDVSVSELAKRSLEEGEEIITETMARVFAWQGKYKRAVEIVEKLILLYPEKRAYFAVLLDDFNKKIS